MPRDWRPRASSIAAWRLHQREQFIDGLLRHRAHAIAVVHAGNVDAADDGSDLVAEVGEKAQGITLLVGDACDQSRDQDLTRDQLAVQFVHAALPLWSADMTDAEFPDNRNGLCAT